MQPSPFGFGQPGAQQPGFGHPAAPGPFGTQSLFGAPQQPAAAPAFGQPQPQPLQLSMFGQQQQQPALIGGGFGAAADIQQQQQQQQQPQAQAFGAFGQPAQPQHQVQPPPFGAPTQQAQPPALFGQPAQPSPFGQPAQPSPFGQPAQPSPFGQPAAAAPGGFAGFGQPLPAAAQPAPSFGAFGGAAAAQPQAQPAFGAGAAAGSAGAPGGGAMLFGRAVGTSPGAGASPGFGQAQQAGEQAQQAQQQAAPRMAFGSQAPARLDFGAAARRRQAAAEALNQAPSPQANVAEEEEAIDYEAEKKKALASAPKFAGGGGGGAGTPTAAPRAAGARAPSPAGAAAMGGANALDAEEAARRAQRAARFNQSAAAGAAAAATAAAPVPRAASPGPGARGSGAGGGAPADSAYGRTPGRGGASGGGVRGGAGGMRRVPSNLGQPAAAPEDNGGVMDAEGEGEEDEAGGVRRGAIVGTCEDMCPAEERARRQGMNDVQIFERERPDQATTNASLAVKRFARTVDDPSPAQFRTRGALGRTMAHLRGILDRTDMRLGLVHKFLWDRYRSVRQDLYIQGMQDEFAVRIFEEIVRFHVLSEHELCGEDQSVTDLEGFNSHLNMEQMNKALISLNDMYNRLSAAGTPINTEPEFRAYHLLSLMSQHGKFKGDQQVFLSTIKGLRPEVWGSPAVQWVLQLQRAFSSNNPKRFFALVRQAPYLLACLAHTYFPQMRRRALRVFTETMWSPRGDGKLELSWLKEVLMLDSEDEAAQLCATYGLEVTVEGGGSRAVALVKGGFIDPAAPPPRYRSQLISSTAPPLRSMAVTSPALQPLSSEEAAAAAAARQRAQQAQQAAAEAARQAAAAEAQRRREAQLAASRAQQEAEERRRQEEVARLAAAQRAAEEQRAREAAAQQAAQQAAALAAQADAARRAAAAAEQQWREEAQRVWAMEQQRLAAEAQRAQQELVARAAAEEAARQAAAREAERRWREEQERRAAEEERRRQEEKARIREAKRRQAISRLFFSRWRSEASSRRAERAKQERLRQQLKACRVGVAAGQPKVHQQRFPLRASPAPASGSRQRPPSAAGGTPPSPLGYPRHPYSGSPTPAGIAAAGAGAAAVAGATPDLSNGGAAQQGQQAQRGGAGALDLPSLVAPLLVQRSPSTQDLYWKVLLLGCGTSGGTAGDGALQQLSILSRWLALQLARGKLAPSPSGSAYVEGPLALQVSNGAAARLSTCLLLPHALHAGGLGGPLDSPSGPAGPLAGASAAILPVGAGAGVGTSAGQLSQLLQSPVLQAVRLPVLLVAPDPLAAQHWQEVVPGLGPPDATGMVHVISVQALSSSGSMGSNRGSAAGSAAAGEGVRGAQQGFSAQQLVQGLRWLAARAPPQPVLEVGSLEAAAREGLGIVLAPLYKHPAATSSDLGRAYNAVLLLLAESIRAAQNSPACRWQWPPPELGPDSLRAWASPSVAAQLLQLLAGACVAEEEGVTAAAGSAGETQRAAMALYHRLGSLAPSSGTAGTAGEGAGAAGTAPPLILPADVLAQLRRRLKEAAGEAAASLAQRAQQQQQQQVLAAALPAPAPALATESNVARPLGVGGRRLLGPSSTQRQAGVGPAVFSAGAAAAAAAGSNGPTLSSLLGAGGGSGGSAPQGAYALAAAGGAGLKRKWEGSPEKQASGLSQQPRQSLLPGSNGNGNLWSAPSGIAQHAVPGRSKLHSALASLEAQLGQERQMQQRLAAQAQGLSGGAPAPAPAATAGTAATVAAPAGGFGAWGTASSGSGGGGGAGGAMSGLWPALGRQQEAQQAQQQGSAAPSLLGELADKLKAEREAAASLQAHLETAAALL